MNTKLHAVSDANGRPLSFFMTAGQVSDYTGKSGRRVVSAFIATAYAQETPGAASGQWRKVADQLRPSVPKLARMMDTAEEDVLAYMSFPPQHRTRLHSTNPLERLNGVRIPTIAISHSNMMAISIPR